MCYFLTVASPLTLSEIRAMLPPGLTADLAPASDRASLTRLHPEARTVAQLLVGACSCDLVRSRQESSLDDEREHRSRYRRSRLSRSEIIRQLERHRKGPTPRPEPPEGWHSALAGFVVEHARNAGPTLYLLSFAPSDDRPGAPQSPTGRSADEIRAARGLGDWLVENRPVIVS